MRTLGNIWWHIPCCGFLFAGIISLFGFLLTLTVIAAPIGLGLLQLGKFLLWPFGHAMIKKTDIQAVQNPIWKTYSTIVMIVYLPFGIAFTGLGVLYITAMYITIIGIPVGAVVANSLGTILNPVNKVCVHYTVADALKLQKAKEALEKKQAK